MVGLAEAPEPKLKLSNFMKILGDQAVADPSRVELRVLQQLQKRVLNHQMRNLAAKKTPQEVAEKRRKALQQDMSKHGLLTAVFAINDFSCTKYRFKVDVHVAQWALSGVAILCTESQVEGMCAEKGLSVSGLSETEKEEMSQVCPEYLGHNLMVIEGGPKAVKKFIKLVTKRSV